MGPRPVDILRPRPAAAGTGTTTSNTPVPHPVGGEIQLQVTFYGVRGSCPCSSEANARYGGNTACVLLEVDGEPPILLDLGTGLRRMADRWPAGGVPFEGTALLTHIHWDHVQGLPFFAPLHRPGSSLAVYGPTQDEGPLDEVFGGFMRPPYFPVHFSQLAGAITFRDVLDTRFSVGRADVTVRPVPHVGPTVGYRIDWNGASVGYVSDHQAPLDLRTLDKRVLELVDGVDLLIHDAQYTPDEFLAKSDWGHCTVDYALLVAKAAGAKQLALFHHDPAHDDDQLDRLAGLARCAGTMAGIDVVASYEGMSLTVGAKAATA